MLLGRYRFKYERSEFHPSVPRLRRAHRLRSDAGLINIAEPVDVHGPDDVCTVRVYCRPKTEYENDGNTRRWGIRNNTNAAIVPFEFTARLSEGKIRHLEFDVSFRAGYDSITGVPPAKEKEEEEEEEEEVTLLTEPAPRRVQGRNSLSEEARIPWNLSSEPISWPRWSSYACGAKWTWIANDHDSFYLHGAVVVKHSDSCFALTCNMRGRVYIPFWDFWPPIGFRYSFTNDGREPRWWQLTPQTPMSSDAEFQGFIDGLNATCESLNLRDGSTLHEYANEPTVNIAPQNQMPRTPIYGNVDLRDTTRLHQGDDVRHNVQFIYNPPMR